MKFTSIRFIHLPIIGFIFSLLALPAYSQYNPIDISGFNQDVVADAGNNALATTTISLDGVTVSNKVMYSVVFRDQNFFGGGALPTNGSIINASGNYQLAPYNSNNALLLPRSQSGDIIINTPSKYTAIRIAAFSTEGPSLVNVKLYFSDGTSTTALTNYNLPDWFNGNTNLIETGFGRCNRVASVVPGDADAFPDNPRLYYIDIPLSCADNNKNLQRINLANVTTAGSNAPYPNAAFFAVSGQNVQGITSDVSDGTCSTSGSASLNISLPGPVNVTWNTTPVQTGPVATNLSPGNYIASITYGAGCQTTFPVTIGQPTSNLIMATHEDTTICSGASFDVMTTSNANTYSWSPITGVSAPTDPRPVLSPTTTTTYTLTGTRGLYCSISRSFTVTVNPAPILNIHADTTICTGVFFRSNTSGNATSYSWLPVTGVSDPGIANPVLSPTTTTTYTVTATTGNCSLSKTFTVTVVEGVHVNAGTDINIIEGQSVQLQGSGSTGTYLWTPATGLNATNILNPVTTASVTTTYILSITSAQGCTGTDDIKVTVIPYCIKAMEAITPNGDGINDCWLVTNGNCISTASVHVYNRYGSAVYENRDYKNNWEGTYKGKPVPDGTYYFVIEYALLNGRNVVVKGNLTILR